MKADQISQQVDMARTLLEQFRAPRVAELLQNTYGISQRSAYRRITDAQNGADIVSNPSKEKGTKCETAVVRAAHIAGFLAAERLALAGAHDMGDVRLCRGVVVEVKGGKAAEQASAQLIEDWLQETEKERVNANADFGLLVTKKKGKGLDSAHLWDARMYFRDFVALVNSRNGRRSGQSADIRTEDYFNGVMSAAPVHMALSDFFTLFKHAGYPHADLPENVVQLR